MTFRPIGGTLALLAGIALFAPAPTLAGSIDTTVGFELDKWYDLGVEEGPVTLHRIRLARESGPVTKSKLFRPFSSEYLQEVVIQLEYSNTATNDWEADMLVEWIDGDGKVIDGYNDDEGLDDRESHDLATVRLSTLKYGLEKARKLKLRISVRPD